MSEISCLCLHSTGFTNLLYNAQIYYVSTVDRTWVLITAFRVSTSWMNLISSLAHPLSLIPFVLVNQNWFSCAQLLMSVFQFRVGKKSLLDYSSIKLWVVTCVLTWHDSSVMIEILFCSFPKWSYNFCFHKQHMRTLVLPHTWNIWNG